MGGYLEIFVQSLIGFDLSIVRETRSPYCYVLLCLKPVVSDEREVFSFVRGIRWEWFDNETLRNSVKFGI